MIEKGKRCRGDYSTRAVSKGALQLIGIARSTYYDKPAISIDDTALVETMAAMSASFEAYGYRRMQGSAAAPRPCRQSQENPAPDARTWSSAAPTSLGVIDRSPFPTTCLGGRSEESMMERYFAGLDVSKDETAICIRDHDGKSVLTTKKATDADAIAGALSASGLPIVTVVMETGRMANWLYHELARRGVPIVCVDASQAHAVLSQMHNKTDANDAAMLADFARNEQLDLKDPNQRVS